MTAQPSLTRTHHWTIEKSVSQPTLTLAAGDSTSVTYSVTVTNTGSTDSDWAVAGTVGFSSDPDITIGAIESFITPGDIAGTIACSPSPFPVALVSGLSCDYEAALPNADPRTAHAKATVTASPDGPGFRQVNTPFDFSTATVTEQDECVDVTDSMAGNLGTVCVGDSPKTFTYTQTIGPFSGCGEFSVPNTATFTGTDTGATGSADANVDVTVPCVGGCTRTIGYWKTHAGFGPQADVVTALLPITLGTPAGAKSVTVSTAALAVQLLSMRGTNNVHDASNGINKLYAQLLGAKLNGAAGTDTSAVSSAMAAADAFLATHDTLSWSGLSGSQKGTVNGWMSTLDGYNNGLVGPDHCD
ncbi:MAG: hypothetical protein ACRDP2_16240 [Nocardioidaceae bacterium]